MVARTTNGKHWDGRGLGPEQPRKTLGYCSLLLFRKLVVGNKDGEKGVGHCAFISIGISCLFGNRAILFAR